MNLADRLLAVAESDPERVALVSGHSKLTYRELAESAAQIRGGLNKEGVGRGDRVGILATGSEFALAYLGTLGAGAIAQPLNPLAPGPELAEALRATETELVVTESGFAAPEEIASESRIVEVGHLLSSEPYPTLAHVEAETPAALLMTSGSSGAARAAVLTHGSLMANLEQLASHEGMRSHPDDVALGILPLFHIFGLNVVLSYALFSGTTVAFPEEESPAGWLEAIARFGATLLLGPPQLYAAWIELDAGPEAFAGVRLAVSGAAPLPDEVFDTFPKVYGHELWQGYGLTEASPVVSSTLMDPEPVRGSVGRPLPGIRVELRDRYGQIVVSGDAGEVWVRGKNVFAGYWNDAEATSRAKEGVWLRTGDLAVADDDGRLYLVDRLSDVIIVSGFNVYPAEVERVLRGHPSVLEASVFGRPSPRTGEEVVASVLPYGAPPNPEDLKAHCVSRLARYKVPVEFHLVEKIPRTAVGKVLRRKL